MGNFLRLEIFPLLFFPFLSFSVLTHSLLHLSSGLFPCRFQEARHLEGPGTGCSASLPVIRQRGENWHQQDWGVPGRASLPSKVIFPFISEVLIQITQTALFDLIMIWILQLCWAQRDTALKGCLWRLWAQIDCFEFCRKKATFCKKVKKVGPARQLQTTRFKSESLWD